MKISSVQKSIPFFASALVAVIAFAFFITTETGPGWNGIGDRLNIASALDDTVPALQQKPRDSAYNALLRAADKYFNDKDYLNAKAAYQVAVSQHPEDLAAKEKLQKTLDLLRAQKAQNILFDVAVSSADKFFQAGDYERAKQEYQNASSMLPGDPYPKNKINEIIKIQVDAKVKGEEYAAAIARADKFYNGKSYREALIDYKKAAAIKPDETYPKERITELNALIAAQKAKDDAYTRAVAMADESFKATQFPDAKKLYQEALVIKPEQAYPKERIREIDAILARKANAQADYEKYVELADSLYIEKQYFRARENYLMASSAKPAEAYPKDMVAKADMMLTGQEAAMAKAMEEQYLKTIEGADKLMAEKSYEPARAEYAKASNLKPAEAYPKDKIREIDGIFAAALKDKEEQYKMAVASGDRSLSNKLYEAARADYQNALSIKPKETYPKSKIAEVEKLIAAEAKEKAADARYANAIGKADSLLLMKAYLAAKAGFQNASNMKPAEVYPKNRMVEINLILYNLEQEKAKLGLYAAAIEKGDKLLAEKSYAQAKAEYEKALSLQPGESYPQDQLTQIDLVFKDLAAKKALDDQYASILANADGLFTEKNWDQARTKYQEALGVKPGETYPAERIAAIDKILAEMAALRSLDENYQAAIGKADQLLAEKTYEQAKNEYLNASSLKPAEQYPKGKVSEIDAILGAIAKQKVLEEEYNTTLAGADKLMAEKSYAPALTAYQAALKLKPAETYPQEKIDEINKIFAEAKALDDRYAGIIAGADKLFAEKTYEAARTEYQNAAGVKPAEVYPGQKIAAIDKILAEMAALRSLDENYQAAITAADRHLAEKSYDLAKNEYAKASALKPAEKYPVAKMTEIDEILAAIAKQKALDDQYAAVIANADKLFAEKSYELSKTQFQSAVQLKPSEQYPKDKITEIDLALADLAKLKALDEQYATAIADADKLLAEKSYAPARSGYENALKIKPKESYPTEKIGEIDAALAAIAAAEKLLDDNYKAAVEKGDQLLTAKSYEGSKAEFVRALELKPAETYPKEKIALIDEALAAIAKQKALDDEYAAIIVAADKLLAERSYEEAKTEYQKAIALKSNEQYPKQKISEIDLALADVARLKAIDDQYNAAIAAADKLLLDLDYDQAKTAFLDAGKIKPAEQYPKDKVNEILAILDGIAKQKALDQQYNAALEKGDQLLSATSYDPARVEFTKAIELKPSEQYPKDKIAEIDRILAELKALEDSYNASVAAADQLLAQKKYEESRLEYQNALTIKPKATYPKEKIAEINKALEELLGKQKYYDNLIVDADNLLGERDYTKSKETYQQALELFPSQPYPQQQINMITARVDSLYRANKSLYDKAVADGDQFFNNYEFDKAVDAYTDAAEYLPMEKYPREMIVKIRRTIAENAIVDVLNTPVTITSNNEKQFPFTPVNIASRKDNFVYIKIKNLSGKPFNVMMRYGKDGQANGGVVMRNLNPDGKVNERLVSVRGQDIWSREDNNWISLYPQGGDVEVSFIQVSRAK